MLNRTLPSDADTAAETISGSAHRQIALYFVLLTAASAMASPLTGLANIPIQYLLKDRLQLSPQAISLFGVITWTPVYLAFLIGLLRDRWRPLGKGDRGYLLLAAPAGSAVYLWLASGQITYGRLLTAVLLAALLFQVLATAIQALTASVAQQKGMTGRLGAVALVGQSVPVALAALLGGWLSSHVSTRNLFVIASSTTAVIALLALWRAKAVFGGQPDTVSHAESLWPSVVRLAKHRPLWPAAALWFVFQFSPCTGTSYFLYVTDKIRVTSEAFGTCNAVSAIAFVPTMALYGALCRRLTLWRSLWWGAAFAVFQMAPLLVIRNATEAILTSALYGLLGGFAVAAYTDLMIRSCPKGLEGTAMALFYSGAAMVYKASDLFGTWLYTQGGFALSVWVTIGVYTLAAPILLLVPRGIVAAREGESALPAGASNAGAGLAAESALEQVPFVPR